MKNITYNTDRAERLSRQRQAGLAAPVNGRAVRRWLSLLLIFTLLFNGFALAPTEAAAEMDPAVTELHEFQLDGTPEPEGSAGADDNYTFLLGNREAVLLSEVLETVQLPLPMEEIQLVGQLGTAENQVEQLLIEPLEENGLVTDYRIHVLNDFAEAGLAVYTADRLYSIRLTEAIVPDDATQALDDFELDAEAELDAVEEAPVYACRLGENAALLSDILAAVGLANVEAQSVALPGTENGDAPALSVEPAEGDYVITALRDFAEARLVVYAAEGMYELILLDGIAPAATVEPAVTPEPTATPEPAVTLEPTLTPEPLETPEAAVIAEAPLQEVISEPEVTAVEDETVYEVAPEALDPTLIVIGPALAAEPMLSNGGMQPRRAMARAAAGHDTEHLRLSLVGGAEATVSLRPTMVDIARHQLMVEAYEIASHDACNGIEAALTRLPQLAEGEYLSLYGIENGALSEFPVLEKLNPGDSFTFDPAQWEGFALVKLGLSEYQVAPVALDDALIVLSGALPVDAAVTLIPAEDDAENSLLACALAVADPEGQPFAPLSDAPVTVSIHSEAIRAALDMGSAVEVRRLDTDEAVEVVSAGDDAVTFLADALKAAYAVREIVLEKQLEASDGNTYAITVAYDTATGIPADAALDVRELSGDEREAYLARAIEALDADTLDYARFFDITLLGPDGTHYQPNDQVTVTIRLLDEMRAFDALSVLHFGEETERIAADVDGASVTFQADSFSVYAITDPVVYHYTYRFFVPTDTAQTQYEEYTIWTDSGEATFTQIIKAGEKLVTPQLPSIKNAPNSTFTGWFEEQTYSGNTATPTALKDAPFDFDNDIPQTFTENQEIHLFAVFSNYAYVIFHEQYHGNTWPVTETRRGVLQNGQTTIDIDDVTVAYDDSSAGQSTDESTAPAMAFRGWAQLTAEQLSGLTAVPEDTPRVTSPITISGNVDLYPVFVHIDWLTFISGPSGSGATYFAPKFFYNDEALESLADYIPERKGYTFAGWYADEACNVRLSDASGTLTTATSLSNVEGLAWEGGKLKLNKNVSIYAKWTSADTTYTVVIWRQKIDDDKNATDAEKTYDFAESHVLSATSGTTVTPDDYTGFAGTGDYSHFHLNTNKTDASAVVDGGGTTVLNVYYDRDLITFDFVTRTYTATYTPGDQQVYDSDKSLLIRNGNNYYYLYYSYGRDTYYVYDDTVLYTLNGSNYIEASSINYGTNYYAKLHTSSDNYYYVRLSWSNVYRTIGNNGWTNNTVYVKSEDTVTYTGLYGQPLSKYHYAWPTNSYWYSSRQDSLNIGYLATVLYEFNANSVAINNGSVPNGVAIQYYVETPEGEEPDFNAEPESYVVYGNGTSVPPGIFYGIYTGFTPVRYRVGNGNWINISANSARFNLTATTKVYFTRDIKTLTFVDSFDNSTLATHSVRYGEALASYAPGFTPTTSRPGYEFSGWYADRECTTRVYFDADEYNRLSDRAKSEAVLLTTMPAANMSIYAGWQGKYYLIQLDPNGGEYPADSNYSTWFWKQYGTTEQVNEYRLTTRDFVESLDGDWYYAVRDRAFYGLSDAWEAREDGIANRRAYYTQDISDPAIVDLNTRYTQLEDAYRYANWYEVRYDDNGNETGEELYNFATRIDHDMTLRLHWKQVGTYYIRYDAGDGTLDGNDNNEEVFRILDDADYADHSDMVVTRTANPPEGYNFVGWRISGADGTVYFPGESFEFQSKYARAEVVNGETRRYLILEAVYSQVGTAKIIYDANGGSLAENANPGAPTDAHAPAVRVDADTEADTLTVSNLVNNSGIRLSNGTGFAFENAVLAGWNTKADGTGDHFDLSGEYYVDTEEPVTLYAEWKVKVWYHLNHTDTNWGGDWDSSVYTYDDADLYYQTVLVNNAVAAPTVVPQYTGAENLTFHYWMDERYSEQHIPYNFSDPVTRELHLFAYWDSPIQLNIHAVDASAEALALRDDPWRVKAAIELHSNDDGVAVNNIALNTSYLSVPGTHKFAFAAIKSATSELSALSEEDAVTRVYFNVQERRVYVKYADAGKPDAPLPDADELYFVYFENPKALNIGYKSMDTSGALADVTVANAAPKTASAGVYNMTAAVTSPLTWANDPEYPFYAFAIGDKNAAAEGNLHFVTSPTSTDTSQPSLRVRNTWRGFQYSTDGGATWTACGYEVQLYVVYFKSQPTIITLRELTRGTETDMREAFEYTVVVEQVTTTYTQTERYTRRNGQYRLDDTETSPESTENQTTTVKYYLSDGNLETITALYNHAKVLTGQEYTTNNGYYFYSNYTITESYQTVTITQTPKTGFVTDNASEGGTKTSNYVWTYTTSANSTDQTVTFTNTHTPLTVEAHVALAVNGGIENRDDTLRTATADDYTLSLPLGGTVTVNAAALPLIFNGDSAVYTLAGIVYGTEDESGAVTAAGSLGSLSYGQIQDNHYELLIDGQTDLPLEGYGLYFVYCEMPKLYYAEEAPDGTLTKLNSLTRNGSAFQLNGVTVAQGTTLQVTDAPFVFSQSAAGGYRLPPDLDGAEHLSLDYYRIGVGGASADSVGALEASSTDKALQLKLMNSQVYYSLDGETWAAFRDAPTVYAIYRKKGFDLTVSKTVANGDTATRAASFTVTVTSDNIEDGAEYTVLKGETVSTVTAEGHTLTLSLKDGESATLHAMKRGNYTIAEPDLDAARFAMSARDKDGRSISVTDGNSVSIVLDNDKTAAITNTRRVSTVTVRKAVDPAPAENEAENFTFTATLLDGEDPVAGFNAWQGNDGVTNDQGQVTFTLGYNGTKALTVPVGAKLILEEAETEKYDVYVNDAEDRSHTIESVSAEAAAVTFTNKLKTFTITLKKVLVDSSAASGAFDFTYTIDNGEPQTLSISPDADETVTVNYGAKLTVTEAANPNYATAATAEKAENAATAANTFTIERVTADDTITFTNTRYVCKVVTADSRYLMHDKDTQADAVFTTLEAAFAAINANVLRLRNGDEPSAYRVEMLVPEYTLTEAVTKNSNLTVTLTTALASDTAYPYAGETSAVIRRGFNVGSMFTTNGAFTLEDITLDGDKENHTTSANGGIVQVASGSLTVNDGATLQNASSTGSGSAVYVADNATMTMTGGSIANNVGDHGAVSVGGENAKLHFSGSAKVTGNQNTLGDACNVCLDRNTAAIINTTGLTAEAAIGVYVTGADGAELYDSRGGNMDAFGLYTGNNSDTTLNDPMNWLSRFVNDRDPSLYGVAHDTGIGEYPTLTGEIVWMKVVPLTITKALEDSYVAGPQTFTFDVKFSEDNKPYYDYKDEQLIRIDASSTRTVNVSGSASVNADVVYVPAGMEITLTETGELDNITTGFTAGEKVNGLSAADRTASFTIDTEATEAAVTVTNRRPPICRIDDYYFYAIKDAVAYVSAEDYYSNSAIIEMLVDYIKPASDVVVIPEGLEITLTSAVEAESPYTITRKTGDTMFTSHGSLTFTNITVDGNSVEADSAMIASDGAVTVDKGALLKNATAGAIHATAGTVAIKDGSITGNRSTTGAAVLAKNADVTVSGGSVTENSATNGAAVYVESGAASFSGGSITQNTATNGGAVGVKDANARLSFSGRVVIKNNTLGTGDDAVASNVCLDQDTYEVINAEGLGEDAYIGVYVPGEMTADLFKNRGAASAKFGKYTSADNVSAFHNDRSANLRVRADSATQTLIWSMPIKVEMRYVSSFRGGFPPQQVGKNIYGPETYYPESSENVVSTIANELYASVKDTLSVTDIMAYGCALHVKATEFEQFLTHVNWYGDMDGGKWGYVRRDGEVIYIDGNSEDDSEDDTLVLYYTTPVFVTIENNTAYTLTVSELKVLDRNAFKQVGSDDTVTTTGYGYVITKDGRTMEDILPIDMKDLTLAPEGSIMLLFPGAMDEACTLKGSFPNEASAALTEIKCTITGTAAEQYNLTHDELTGFTREGTIPDATGASLTYLFGEAKPICKITDDHLFPTLTEAMDYIKTQSDKSAEYRVEMLVDYQIPATDVARIPKGYNVTLSTAVSGNYKYSDDANARATISRATGNGNSFITALDADTNTSLTVQNLNFDGKDAILFGDGGAIKTKDCAVTINNADFRNFKANNGGAVYIEFSGDNKSVNNSLTVDNTNFTNCESNSTTNRQGGGAIWTNTKTFNLGVGGACTFTNCSAVDQGGAVFHRIDDTTGKHGWKCYYQAESVSRVENCSFVNCSAHAGGGLELDALDVTLTNCDFTRCTASQRNGGGCNIYIYDSGNSTLHSEVRATNCTFTGCKTVNIDGNTNYGGGLRSAALETYVTNCKFENNTSGGNGGGGLAITNTNATVAEVNDCKFIGNVANSGNGGGVYYGGANTTLLLDNCTVKGNTTSGSGGGVYTSGNLTLRNHTVISNNRLSTNTNTATNAAGAYIPNGKTLFVGGAGSTSRDLSSVFNNTTSDGTASNLRLSETGSENSQTSVSVLSNLGGEINVVNAKVRGTQFGSVAQSGYSVVSGGEPVFKGDDGVLYGVKVEQTKLVWDAEWICKITDGQGHLLYKSDGSPALYMQLDNGKGSRNEYDRAYAFSTLAFEDPELYTTPDCTQKYTGTDYCVKMLVDSYTLKNGFTTERRDKGRNITFTTAGTDAAQEDGYPSKTGSCVIYRGAVTGTIVSTRGNLKLENITLDGGSKSGKSTSDNGGIINIKAAVTVELGEGAVLQYSRSIINGGNGGNGGAVYINNSGTFTMNGGTIKSCSAVANGGGVYQNNGTFNMNSGSAITSCQGANGGGVYQNNGTFNMNSGSAITGCTAQNGGALFVANSRTFNMNGGSITGNKGTSRAGGIAIGGGSVNLIFAGNAVVRRNTQGSQEYNVELNQDKNTVINAKGLTSEADIGVYVTGDKAASLYQKHGINGMPFGTWTSNDCLYRFVNDRDRELRGTFKSTDKLIYWERILCLEVGKTVESEAEKDKDLEFEFTVKLTDWNEGEKKYGDMTFNADGEATFKLKHGQYMALLDDTSHTLETKEYAYTVTEKVAEGFETSVEKDDKGASKANSITGRIGENAPTSLVSKVMFTNTRKTGDLYVSKAVDSESDAEKEKLFVFEVDLGDESIGAPTEDNPEGGKTCGDMTFVEGVATFTLKHGESKKAEGLPYGLNVVITETGIWDEALEREMPLENYSTSVERIVGTPPEPSEDDAPAGDDPEETDGAATPADLRDDTYDTAKREYRVTNFSEEALTIAFTNSNGGFDVALIKIDGEGNPLDGATFALYPDDGAAEPEISGEPVATAESATLESPVTVQLAETQEDGSEKVVSKTVSGEGIVVFEKLAPGKYLLKETVFPVYDETAGSKYLPENTEKPLYRLELNNDGTYTLATQDGAAVPSMTVGEEEDAAQLPSILNLAPVDRKVILRKVQDGDIYESLKDKAFTLKYVNGAVIADALTSSDNGAIWIGRLPLGTYYLDEVDPAVRFTVSVTADGVTVTKSTD